MSTSTRPSSGSSSRRRRHRVRTPPAPARRPAGRPQALRRPPVHRRARHLPGHRRRDGRRLVRRGPLPPGRARAVAHRGRRLDGAAEPRDAGRHAAGAAPRPALRHRSSSWSAASPSPVRAAAPRPARHRRAGAAPGCDGDRGGGRERADVARHQPDHGRDAARARRLGRLADGDVRRAGHRSRRRHPRLAGRRRSTASSSPARLPAGISAESAATVARGRHRSPGRRSRSPGPRRADPRRRPGGLHRRLQRGRGDRRARADRHRGRRPPRPGPLPPRDRGRRGRALLQTTAA